MKIRKANLKDIKGIIEIFKDSAVLNPRDKNFKELRGYISDTLKNKKFLVLIAEIDNQIIGVAITLLNDFFKTDARLIDLYVLKSQRNKGIGSLIIKQLYKELIKRKITNLGLYSENNPKTINFYKKQGFQIGRLIRRCDKKIK
jgi:ribosomal protein S18 acetylase RimI-like enzyme